MTLRISGRNVDIGDATRTHVENRIAEALEKYYPGAYSGHVTISREGSGFRSECTLSLSTGVVLQVSGESQDARQSFDIAAERIEKRLRRYNRKLKAHKNGAHADKGIFDATSYVLADPESEEEVPEDYNPIVVAETSAKVKTMTVGMAVMELDLTEAPVVMFRNAGNGGVNVVFRRADGNIGWIDPGLVSTAEAG
ncbi:MULTISPECIES: ribosome hibernation-promoting factor, HPF/YfiA family [Pseudovibrio]|uniref:ribosome hibernation-promoting factor, HPF/YfiA family n=1 Tax=Stappiaceae TaxID=2821832 RepID=UPI002364FC9C|nr:MULTISPECIES: ribosome-associated translation inhibitor RaiA [Pseudovibrio]MDD7909808.1 ribosome-associated translation inhibitor RaiA [Pseudovibrio exalbescens]MDX5592148.1 ribosome-associated translation inhibitor RaiA [Pseudovibrio sp. SPO723]